MKKIAWLWVLLIMAPFSVAMAGNYELYPEACAEMFHKIDALTDNPERLKNTYNLTVSSLEQVKWAAIEEIEANPADEAMICAMVEPALNLLITVRQPKATVNEAPDNPATTVPAPKTEYAE